MSLKKFIPPLLLLFLFAVLALLAASCQQSNESVLWDTVTAPPATETGVASPTAPSAATASATSAPTEMTTTAPTATAETAPVSNRATLAEAGIALDAESPLLESVTVETVPVHPEIADHGPRYLLQPAHTVLYLGGYPLSHSYLKPTIVIYPVEAYVQLSLAAEQEIAHLRALLEAWPHPEPMPGEDHLPYLPEPHAAQILHARATRLTFRSGNGIRYITQYVQDVAPITSSHLQYTFQGLSDDGQFYVSASMPIGSEALPEDTTAAQAEGFDSLPYNFDRIGYEAYLSEQQAMVNDLPDGAFSPELAALDALMQSLDLAQYSGPDASPWAPDVAPAPDQVVDDFLESYVAAGGFPAGAHRENPHLHADFVAQAESTVEAFRARGIEAKTYDPVLMTALGPAEYGYGFDGLKVGRASIEGDTATVRVERDWHYTLAVSPLRYTLGWNGERWQITDVSSAGVSVNILREVAEPERVTERFYESMIAAAGQFRMPSEWLEHVDPDLVTPDVTVELCDWVWPVGVAIEGSFVQPAPLYLSTNVEEEAYVVVHLPVKGGLLTVHLVRERDSDVWQVRETSCSDSPQGKALAFYSWYLGEAAVAADGGETRWAPRAPYIDTMNPVRAFTTERFLREAWQRFQEDPYLPSGRVADRFSVEAGPQETIVFVHLEYLGETEATVETLQVTLAQDEDWRWVVDNVERAP